ncbi:MAG TPA: hypothetical protein VF101_06500 [Gaiellaceae bacterium]
MKRAATAVVAAVALACAAPAGATTQKGPTAQSLQRQITQLQGQVKKLNKQVTALKKQVTTATGLGAAALTFSVCSTAATADTFTSTFTVIDQIAQGTQGKTYIGPQAGLNDQGACQALRITRATPATPNLGEFSALLALLAPGFVRDTASVFTLRAAP